MRKGKFYEKKTDEKNPKYRMPMRKKSPMAYINELAQRTGVIMTDYRDDPFGGMDDEYRQIILSVISDSSDYEKSMEEADPKTYEEVVRTFGIMFGGFDWAKDIKKTLSGESIYELPIFEDDVLSALVNAGMPYTEAVDKVRGFLYDEDSKAKLIEEMKKYSLTDKFIMSVQGTSKMFGRAAAEQKADEICILACYARDFPDDYYEVVLRRENSKVGPFFYVDGMLIYDAKYITDPECEVRGDIIDNPCGHAELFERYYPGREYIDCPRGRVVYDTRVNDGVIYVDKCIDEKTIVAISEIMQLHDFSVQEDEHYRCPKCMKEELFSNENEEANLREKGKAMFEKFVENGTK